MYIISDCKKSKKMLNISVYRKDISYPSKKLLYNTWAGCRLEYANVLGSPHTKRIYSSNVGLKDR